jgi:hypothetical protein
MALFNGVRPERKDYPNSTPLLDDRMWELLHRCWREEPKKRLSIDAVVGDLDVLMQRESFVSSGVVRCSFPDKDGH